MNIPLIALNASILQSQILKQAAGVAGLPIVLDPPARDVMNTLAAEHALCLVVCDADDGAQALSTLEGLPARPALTSLMLAPRPSIAAALRAGRLGVLHFYDQACSPETVASGMREAIENELQIRQIRKTKHDFNRRIRELSPGEEEVLRWVLFGVSNKLIARRLKVSQRTVESRRQKVFKKMEIKSLAELVRLTTLNANIDEMRPATFEDSMADESNQLDVAG